MMNICRYLLLIGCVALAQTTSASSDDTFNTLNTLIILQQSGCQGGGGQWTGMTCDQGPGLVGGNTKDIGSNELTSDGLAEIEELGGIDEN